MQILKPEFKLPEVAYGAGVSASNLTNWYDRSLVTTFCREKDGWKRFSAVDVYHVSIVKQLVVLGVPVPHANDISKGYLEYRMIGAPLVPVSPMLFVMQQHDEMLFVEPAGEEYRVVAYDRVDGIYGKPGEFPVSERAHIIMPVFPVLKVALARAMTGRDDVALEFDPEEAIRFSDNVRAALELKKQQEAAEPRPGSSSEPGDHDNDLVPRLRDMIGNINVFKEKMHHLASGGGVDDPDTGAPQRIKLAVEQMMAELVEVEKALSDEE
ncbi:MAG TPA: hypothetical protein VGE05_15525 [Novosphingobium sp.]